MIEGRYTAQNVWDKARSPILRRYDSCLLKEIKLDPGVNYFILALDRLGCRTVHSCEGHPNGFYIHFAAPYRTALKIAGAGYFGVGIEWAEFWSLRIHADVTPRRKVDILRWAAQAWEKKLFGRE